MNQIKEFTKEVVENVASSNVYVIGADQKIFGGNIVFSNIA